MMMSSETSTPLSMTCFAASPSGEPAFTAARSMSPVEICGMPYASRMNAACVPLPAPGEGGQKAHAGEIFRRVDARRRRAVGNIDDDPVTVMQRAQLLERLERFG